MKILVTGTPGVGKTTLSKRIAEKFSVEHIDVTSAIKENKLYESYDQKLDTLIFDEETVIKFINNYVSNISCFIIDTHSPVVGEGIKFDFIFHIICDPSTIRERLAKREYDEYKIQNNIESQIFDVVGEELEEFFEDEEIFKVNGSDIPIEDAEYNVDDILELLENWKIKST